MNILPSPTETQQRIASILEAFADHPEHEQAMALRTAGLGLDWFQVVEALSSRTALALARRSSLSLAAAE